MVYYIIVRVKTYNTFLRLTPSTSTSRLKAQYFCNTNYIPHATGNSRSFFNVYTQFYFVLSCRSKVQLIVVHYVAKRNENLWEMHMYRTVRYTLLSNEECKNLSVVFKISLNIMSNWYLQKFHYLKKDNISCLHFWNIRFAKTKIILSFDVTDSNMCSAGT